VRTYVEQHRALWRCAREQIVTLEAALAQHQAAFAAPLRHLQTIPGVGPIVATTAIAIFSDVGRFPDAKHDGLSRARPTHAAGPGCARPRVPGLQPRAATRPGPLRSHPPRRAHAPRRP
jgi:Transposase IS116/IS110/IS902 family